MKIKHWMVSVGVGLAGCSVSQQVRQAPAYECAPKAPAPAEDGLLVLVIPEKTALKPTAGVLRLAEGAPQAQLAADDTKIEARVFGPVAQVTVKQTFRNTTGKTVDADWLLPVPLTAVVMDLTVDIGERHFRAVMVDEAQAKALYAKAVAQGRHAAMVHAEEAGWRLRLGQVRAGERVGAGVVYGEVFELSSNPEPALVLPAGGHWSVVMDYGANFQDRARREIQGEKGGVLAFFKDREEYQHMFFLGKFKAEPEIMDGDVVAVGVDYTNGDIDFIERPKDDWEEKNQGAHHQLFMAMAGAKKIKRILEMERLARGVSYEVFQDPSAEILALARKHKIIVPGLSLLMVDAKK